MVLFDGFLCVFMSLVDNCGRAKELAELVSVELALFEFSKLLKKSLYQVGLE